MVSLLLKYESKNLGAIDGPTRMPPSRPEPVPATRVAEGRESVGV